MITTDVGAQPPTGPRRRRAALLAAAALLSIAVPVVHATEGETYPQPYAPEVESLVTSWSSRIKPPVVIMCTGKTEFTGTEELRDPENSTPLGPWTPITGAGGWPAADGGSELAKREGGDTDRIGFDDYLLYRVVVRRANVLVRAILETEDDEDRSWSVRVRGTETVRIQNGAAQRADTLVLTNRWAVAWNRRVIDFDARDGEFDEEKTVTQDFGVRLDLLDGSSRAMGETFRLSRPSGVTSRSGVSLTAGAERDEKTVPKLGVGLEWGTTKTFSDFVELAPSEAEHVEGGDIVVSDLLPCPSDRAWTIATAVSGDFACYDHEWFNGSKGARQELTLEILNLTTSVLATECRGCGTAPLPPPTRPVPLPPPTTPTPVPPEGAPAPTTPTTPTEPSTPTPPTVTAPTTPSTPTATAPSVPPAPVAPTSPTTPAEPVRPPADGAAPAPVVPSPVVVPDGDRATPDDDPVLPEDSCPLDGDDGSWRDARDLDTDEG